MVTGLYTDDNTHNFKMDKPARTIAIDPIYARANSGRRFMTTSEDKLIIHEKTFLSRFELIFTFKVGIILEIDFSFRLLILTHVFGLLLRGIGGKQIK